jgi:hypothetical protein
LILDDVTGEQLRIFYEGGLASLTEQQEEINRLNVFPVPDGDTGRNMCLTVQAAVQELKQAKSPGLSGISDALAKGSLMGARGNSGVILSQLIRGFADAVRGSDRITTAHYARAWQTAVSTAYQAVMQPVEGTMLTVAKGFSLGLNEAAKTATDLGDMLSFALQKGNETLQRTPDLLPVLKRAGVVDAGGKGLMVFIEGGLNALSESRPQRPQDPVISAITQEVANIDGSGREGIGGNNHLVSAGAGAQFASQPHPATQLQGHVLANDEDFTYVYCTEFVLRSDPACLTQLRNNLQEYGGSMVVGAIDDVIKVHIHTNQPGQVLEYCLQLGTLHNIQISNMRDQWEQVHGESAAVPDLVLSAYRDEAVQKIGVLAVAAGEGIEEIFRSLGAVQIVSGGQTMNPPVEDFIRAIEAMPNEQTLILPNNKNLIMAAEQAGKLISRSVSVLPTTSIQAGISAMLAFNPLLDMSTNIDKMEQAAGRVKAGEVTYAVRDAVFNNTEIRQGSLIGLWQGDIVEVGDSLEQVALAMIDRMLDEGDELVTLLTGKEVPPDEADRIVSLIRGSHPQIEVEVQYGGQPVYYFLISID